MPEINEDGSYKVSPRAEIGVSPGTDIGRFAESVAAADGTKWECRVSGSPEELAKAVANLNHPIINPFDQDKAGGTGKS